MLPGAPCVSNVTLCNAANDQVTTPFRVTVTLRGSNELLAVAETLAVAPGAGAADTVTLTSCVFVTVPTVPLAVMRAVPAATPVTTPAFVTVATAWLADVYVTVSPDIVAPV